MITVHRPVPASLCLSIALSVSMFAGEGVNRQPDGSAEEARLSPAWADPGILYQMNLHNYTPEGTIRAAMQHLPRLARLGVNILWLMPIHPRGRWIPPEDILARYKGSPWPAPSLKPFNGNPYCPWDHQQLDPALGTTGDLKAFVNQAHKLGMKVILGWVPNHTGWGSPLMQKHPEFFMHGDRGQILYHDPWKPIARLDYRNRDLWDYMLKVRRYWIEQFGFDGFREDVAAHTPLEHWRWLREKLDPQRKLLFLAEANDPKLIGPLDMCYDWMIPAVYWQILAGKKHAIAIDRYLTGLEQKYPAKTRFLRYLFNHDQNGTHRGHWQARHIIRQLYGAEKGPGVPTHAQKYGEALLACMTLQFTLPRGRPLLFMGQEIGFLGRVPHNRAQQSPDHPIIPWHQPPQPQVPQFYTALCWAYRDHPAFYRGTYSRIDIPEHPNLFAFTRQTAKDRVLVAVNLQPQAAEWVLPRNTLPVKDLLGAATPVTLRPKVEKGKLTLPPWGLALLQCTPN